MRVGLGTASRPGETDGLPAQGGFIMSVRTARTLVELAPGERAGATALEFATESFIALVAKTPGSKMVSRPRFVGFGNRPPEVEDTGSRIAVYETDIEVGL